MPTRRQFLKTSVAVAMTPAALANVAAPAPGGPVVISTWEHGVAANEAAWRVLASGGRALDAVEAGVRVSESDPNVNSVGYGGLPDRDGKVTLDACLMDEAGRAGAVAFLQHIKNPISVARLVMERTDCNPGTLLTDSSIGRVMVTII